METNAPGVYLPTAAGVQQRYTPFIENCHEHAGKIRYTYRPLVGRRWANVPQRNVELDFSQISELTEEPHHETHRPSLIHRTRCLSPGLAGYAGPALPIIGYVGVENCRPDFAPSPAAAIAGI